MPALKFLVPCVPVAQPRQRHRVLNAGGRLFTHNYTPTKDPVNAFKAAVQVAAIDAIVEYAGFELLDCPLVMELVFVLPRPASVPKRLGCGRLPHTGKPDRDNLMKSVQDALEGILFRNDSLIYDGSVSKWKAAVGESSHVEIVMRW